MKMQTFPAYFLGANSARGFVNRFSDCFSAKDGWKAILIKGGPGCGKSTFMKRVAVDARERGEAVTVCPCSSDPDSLDAVILPGKKLAVMDATAPHTLDPEYPGVCERILDFSAFWDVRKLAGYSSEILRLTDENRACHHRASGYLRAYGECLAEISRTALLGCDLARLAGVSERLSGKIPTVSPKPGSQTQRYLSGFTPKGYLTFFDTVRNFCETTVLLRDEYGCASDIVLSLLRDTALEKGHRVVVLLDPVFGEDKIDHLILPDCGMAFCSENSRMKWDLPSVRRKDLMRYYNREILEGRKKRLKMLRKLGGQLEEDIVRELAAAKAVHDELERPYGLAMDFARLEEVFRDFVQTVYFSEKVC